MIADARLAAARAQAEAARLKLAASVDVAKARLSPTALAIDAMDGVKARAGEIASGGVDAVRRRPAIAAGALAAIGLLLARRPLTRAIGRIGGDDETAEA